MDPNREGRGRAPASPLCGPDSERLRVDEFRRDRDTLVVCAGILVLSAVIRLHHGTVQAGEWELPPICGFRALTGQDCPGCGLTRGFVLLVRGRWGDAGRMNPMAPALFLLTLLQFPYRVWVLWKRIPTDKRPRAFGWVGPIHIAALVLCWLARL